ncbi:MAG: hypothetical protein V1929_08775 [bacterium]
MINIDANEAMTWVVGFAWAFIAIQWLYVLRQVISLKSDVIPADINLGERDTVKKHIEILVGSSVVAVRARALLTGWAQGWRPNDVVVLSASQSARDTNRLNAAGLFMLLVLAACVTQSEQAAVAWIGIAALGATIFAKGLVLARIDSFIEENLLTRLPANLPGTAMTAAELAAQLGHAINEAFKNNVPQPDKMAAAVNASVENFRKASLESLESLQKKLGDSQGAMIEKWTAHEKQTSRQLEDAKKSFESLAASFASGETTGAKKLQAALASHVQQLEKVTTAANAQAQGSMSTHAEQFAKASQAIASQFDKIVALDLAAQLGHAINEAFKNSVPQPDKMAAAVNASVENFRKASLESLESLQKKLGDSQGAMIENWTTHEKKTSERLEVARKALESLAASFESGETAGVKKLQAALASHVQQLEKVTTASNAQAQGSMSTHAEQFAKASEAIASQLDKIMALEKDIQKILHLQQLVDGTMKSVSTAEEFKQTLAVLRTHIEASDKLLNELSKPRTIRLVETETAQKPAAAIPTPAQNR